MNSGNRFNNNNNNNKNTFKPNRFVSKQVNEERNKKQKEEEFMKSLHSSISFPDLQTSKNSKKNKNNDKNEVNQNQPINFMGAVNMNTDVAKTKENKSENDKADDVPPPGCVCIKYDEATKKTIWIYGENTNGFYDEKPNVEEDEDPRDVFQRLVNLHQSRKYEHIRKWGFDEYDKMFLYQNYDYEYFDKLDEDIERNMESYYRSNTSYYENNEIDSGV
jgi:hypothetical protein